MAETQHGSLAAQQSGTLSTMVVEPPAKASYKPWRSYVKIDTQSTLLSTH